jgi:hypothetical protein
MNLTNVFPLQLLPATQIDGGSFGVPYPRALTPIFDCAKGIEGGVTLRTYSCNSSPKMEEHRPIVRIPAYELAGSLPNYYCAAHESLASPVCGLRRPRKELEKCLLPPTGGIY